MNSTDLRRDIRRLWGAYSVSELGSAVGYGALPLVALLVLRVSDWQVSVLAAVGGLTSAALALPLGPVVEHRRKRPVMIAADLVRAAACLSVPMAAWAGVLTFAHLCVVSVLSTTGAIAFAAASQAHLKALVPAERRTEVNSRFETTFWSALTLGPPIGGLLVSWVGSTMSVLVDGVSFVLSALGVRSLRTPEPPPPVRAAGHHWLRDITAGWAHLWAHPGLRSLFLNALLFGGALMLASPLQAVLMLRELGFAPWQYGLAMGLPSIGGVIGAALTPRLVHRLGERKVLLGFGVTRALWLAPIAVAPAGTAGLVVITLAELATLLCAGVFNPTFVTYRMTHTADTHMARVAMAWSVSARVVQPLFMLLGGALAAWIGLRAAIGVGAVILLATIPLLPWRNSTR